jgi:hypothetical protein
MLKALYEAGLIVQLFVALDREQPVQSGLNADVTGGCSRPVIRPLGGTKALLCDHVVF